MNLEQRNQDIKEFFTKKINDYDKVHLTMMDTKNVLNSSLDKNTKKILDLGVGTGLELISLFQEFKEIEVTAIDITEAMLDELKKRDFANRIKIICGDFFKVDFGTDYDAVISTSALHHFSKEDKTILYKKIYDCLKKGGQFINSDRFVDTYEEEQKMMLELIENKNNSPHIDTPLWIKTEEEILTTIGFHNIEFIDSTTDSNYKLLKTRK